MNLYLSSVISKWSCCWDSMVDGDTASLAGETLPRSMTLEPDLIKIWINSNKFFRTLKTFYSFQPVEP